MSKESSTYRYLKESVPVLLLCGFGLMVAGMLFGLMVETLEDHPGILVLIPAIIGMRGNISTALGARLGSASHLGLISTENIMNRDSMVNIKASLALSVLMGLLAGVVAHISLVALGRDSSGLLVLVSISVLAGFLSGLALAAITLGIMVLAFRKGYDPDNITGPLLSTVGDIITLLLIFGTATLIFAIDNAIVR